MMTKYKKRGFLKKIGFRKIAIFCKFCWVITQKGQIVWNWYVEFKDPENIQLEQFALDDFFHPTLTKHQMKAQQTWLVLNYHIEIYCISFE